MNDFPNRLLRLHFSIADNEVLIADSEFNLPHHIVFYDQHRSLQHIRLHPYRACTRGRMSSAKNANRSLVLKIK